MTKELLKFIDDNLVEGGINYEFGQWSSSPIPSPYFIGEFTETEPIHEDGLQKSTFMLTGTSKNSWLELIEARQKIEEIFPCVEGKIALLENHSSVAIYFDNALVVPTDTMDLKRMQLNLIVYEWKGK